MNKRENRTVVCLYLLVFMLSVSVSYSLCASLLTSNYNNLDSDTDLETSDINTLYNGKSYPFEIKDVYDDANSTKIYTDAYLQTEYDLNGTVFEDEVSVVNNTNYKSPSNTGITMIDGTFDDTDNMRANDDSNSEFTSFGAGSGTVYLDPDGDVITQWVPDPGPLHYTGIDNGIRQPADPGTGDKISASLGYNNKIDQFTFEDDTVGTVTSVILWHYGRASTGEDPRNKVYIGGGWTALAQCGFAATAWKSRDLGGGWSQADINALQVYYLSYSAYGEYDYSYIYATYFEVNYDNPTELNFTVDLNFDEVDTSKLLALDVSSHHYTNISTTITGNVYNYDTSSYVEMFSSNNVVETENYFVNDTIPSDFLNSSGNLRLYFTGIGNSFELAIDYIRVRFYYKMDIIIYKTFYINGIWQYRFKLVGSLHYTDWTVFEVIDPPDNFYAISESELTTRWRLQDNELTSVEDFHDDINTDYWNLVDVSIEYFQKLVVDSSSYLLDNSSYTGEVEYTGTHFDTNSEDNDIGGITWDGSYFWVVGFTNKRAYKYTSAGAYTGISFNLGGQTSLPWGIEFDGTNFWVVGLVNQRVYKYTDAGAFVSSFDVSGEETQPYGITYNGTTLWVVGVNSDEVHEYTTGGVHTGTSFSVHAEDWTPYGITWDGYNFWVVGGTHATVYQYTSAGVYTGSNFIVYPEDALTCEIEFDGEYFWVSGEQYVEVYKYGNTYNISKNYFGSGYTYMQTNITESIGLQSIDYTTHYNLDSGDYFEIFFQTSSDSQIYLILLKDGVVNKTLTLSSSGNTNFNNQTGQIGVDEFVEFDQLKISSTFEDTDYVRIYDIKTYKYTIVGDSADFLVGSSDRGVYLTPDTYNLRIFDPYDGYVVINENITIPETGVKDYVYTPIETKQCRIAFFNPQDVPLTFTDYHVYVNRSLGDSYSSFALLENIFSVDVDTIVYIEIKDRFNTLIRTYEKEITPTIDHLDIELEVYSLQIKNLMEQQTTVEINITYVYPLLSGESICFMLSEAYYQIRFLDEYDSYKNFTVHLISNQAYQLNSSLKTIYFSMFTYDGLGINYDFVRFYINGARKDFGFNSMLEDTLELVILDFFNNTLANETIDANAYDNSEYNLFVEIYTLNILNQFTYEDIIVNITQVGSGIWMTQIIPKQFALVYRFLPDVEYNITIYFTNATLYASRIVNLTTNSHIESFGVPTTTPEYPKDVYFGVYTTTGLGVDHDLLRFYIDGNRTDFGFNRIEDQIIGLVVKDYFNTTLFNQNVNTSGIYEYNILITLYSLKIRNEARISTNYTLKLGGLETTGFILPDEIIAYQLATNNYVFDYTNNEDNTFHTININLNQDRVYILNTTYYNIYFSLFDLSLHTIDPDQYEFRLNGTREGFGFIYDLTTDDYTITVIDRFGTSLFNDVVTLRGLNEYKINITLYELQVRHLASESSNLILTESISGNDYSFIMTPDSIKSIIIGSADYTLNWTNGENAQITLISIALTEDRVVMLNSTYYDVYFSLYDQNGVRLDDSLFSLYLNGTRKDFGFVNLESIDVLIVVQDYLNFTAFNSVITLSEFTEYNIIITVFELQIRHLAQENSNLTLYETTTHNCINFSMSPDSLNKYMLSDSTYNITWTNGENGISTFYGITLNENYILTLDSTYYDIYFSLFDVNLHTIDPCQYVFRLNGTIKDFGLITDLQTDNYIITVIDRFGTSLFDSIVNLRGLNEYRINITLYELQIRHLAREIGNMSLYETTGHSSFNFSMAPDTIRSFILGSSTYNITWINGENGVSTFYDINLNSDCILTLNTTFYDVYFSLYDQNGVRLDDSLFSLYLNGTRKDFGFVELESNDVLVFVQDYLNVTVFNQAVGLSGYTEYSIIITVFELQIRHLAQENSNLTLYETTTHNHINFSMSPDSLNKYMLSDSTYNITWINGENSISTFYSITLNENYILTLDSSYYNIYFSLYDVNLHIFYPSQYVFRLNGTIQDFGLIADLTTDDYNITVVDRFGTSLFDNIITLRDLNEYRIDITLYELQIRHLARVNGNLTLSETTTHNYFEFLMSPNSQESFILGSSTYNVTWLNNENSITTTYDINLIDNYILTLNTTYYDTYFSLYDQNGVRLDDSLFSLYLNGSRKDFGFVELSSADVLIVVQDRLNYTAFNSVITLNGFTEYNIIITVFELQIRHLAQENSNLTLYETTTHNHINFSMSPDSLNKFMLSDSTYNLTWINGEDSLTTIYDIVLNSDYILTLNSTYYNIFFSLYDLNLHTINPDLYEFRLNGTREVLGLIEDLQTDDYVITIIDRFGTSLFDNTVSLRGLNEYMINVSLYELQIRHLARENGNLTLSETTGHSSLDFNMAPDSLKSFILGSSTYNVTWLNNENSITTTYDINLIEDYILTLNTSYYDIYFSLFDLNLHTIYLDQYEFRLNGTLQDLGLIVDLQTDNYNITIIDRFGNSLFNNIVTLRELNEYRINITLYELQIRHLARENSNLTLTESISGNDYSFIMTPDSITSIIIGSADYILGWTNGENGLTASISIALTEDRVVMLNTSYYDIFFSLFDVNLHTIDSNQYGFRLNGTIYDFGLITDLQTDNYTISVVDRFGTSLFNNIVNLRGLNEYRIDISLYEIQIRHLAREIGNMSLYETTRHSSFNFSMAPDTIRSFILGSSTYNITWFNGENGLSIVYDINLNSDYILTLNTTFYDVYFSLYDQNGVRLDDSLFSLYVNGSRKDFGFVELESNNTLVFVQDYLNVTVFNQAVGLSGYTGYNIIITVFELQIRHLAYENSNLTLYETTSHNYLNFSMAPDTIRFFMLANSTYNITWINGENLVSTLYDITLDENYILLLDTTYYSVHFSIYNFDGLGLTGDLVRFYINGVRRDFGSNVLKQEVNNLKVLDFFNATIFDQNVNLGHCTEYNILVEIYTLIINNNYTRSIRIEIERDNSNIVVIQIIPAQSGLSYRFLPDIVYTITAYDLNGTSLEVKHVDLVSNNKIVSFGFYSTEVPYDPEPLVFNTMTLVAFIIIICVFGWIIVIAWVYMKKDIDIIPEDTKLRHRRKRKAYVDREKGFYDHT